jgi:putative colanic acid biosynthesis UDP-glucose lipid carrier transferase
MTTINQDQYIHEITVGTNSSRIYIDEKKKFFLLKRAIDLFFSTFVILFVLSWLVPLIAIAIKIDSKGPVFFVQRRVGRGIKSFSCIKFRTMVVNEQANSASATSNDCRITSLGKFLRQSSLDELPQFINVWLGQMSIVGPRPHMHADCKRFSQVVDNYKFRNFVKPGITGLAQIKGFRGPAKNGYAIIHRYQYDDFYVRNAGLFLDLKIMWHTAKEMLAILFSKIKPSAVHFPGKIRKKDDKLAA